MNIFIAGACSWFLLTGSAAINVSPGPYYIACRWDYSHIANQIGVPRKEVKNRLKNAVAHVENPKTGKRIKCRIADWGPHRRTGRAVDMSKGLMKALGVETDQIVHVHVVIQ